jgi:hypothetical protein
MNAGEEREFIANLITHLNRYKPKQFAICMAYDPCDCGRVPEGEILAYGLINRRGISLLEQDGTLLGLYDTLEQAHARAIKGYGEATRTYIAWMTPELTEPPSAFPTTPASASNAAL